MKKMKSLMIVALMAITMQTFAQTPENYLLKKGTRIETIEFNDKKVQTKTKVLTVESVDGNTSKIRTVTTEKGTVTENNLQTYRNNESGAFFINDAAIDSKTKKAAEIRYPANMQAGQKLNNDVNYEASGKTPEGKTATMFIKMTDRKVIGNERITVKGGTWDCVKLSYKFSFGFKLGLIKIPFNVSAVEWYNPEVGVVKTEYSLKGKYAGHSEISSVK